MVVTAVFVAPAEPAAQRKPAHLNPMVEKLSRGEVALGVSTGTFTVENARAIARSGVDYVYLDMEHGVMNVEKLRNFMMAMNDKATALKAGNPGPPVSVHARFAPYAFENSYWVVKQALDMGMTGIMFNNIETKEQAMRAVQIMRYPQNKGSRYPEPVGLRGHGAEAAEWFWGVEEPDYLEHADVWPLNPQGDLLAMMMIETEAGVKNVNEIAQVPGVSLYISGGSDLSMSYGVFPQRDSPAVEAARQAVLKACRDYKGQGRRRVVLRSRPCPRCVSVVRDLPVKPEVRLLRRQRRRVGGDVRDVLHGHLRHDPLHHPRIQAAPRALLNVVQLAGDVTG
jgi:4-hydroxy-2-oxoheptanedioate aldolase